MSSVEDGEPEPGRREKQGWRADNRTEHRGDAAPYTRAPDTHEAELAPRGHPGPLTVPSLCSIPPVFVLVQY